MSSQSVAQFWSLLGESGLTTAAGLSDLQAEFAQVKGAAQGNVALLAAWLVDRGAVTEYQRAVLVAGRAGPFDYGDYRIIERESQGWLSGMFRAVHRPTEHPVLLRFLSGDYLRDEALWTRTADQTLTWSRMVNRHLARYYQAQDLGRFRFLVLEDLRGATLADCLAQGGALASADVAHLGRLSALGLAVLHQTGQAHGRISPRAIWLSHDGNVKVVPEPLPVGDASGVGVGADLADYLAPELVMSPQAAPLSDIYALGCVLYEALAGHPPFAGGNAAQKQQRHAAEPVRPLVGVSEDLQQLLWRMMAKSPAARLPTAAVASQELAAWVDAPRQAFRPPPPPATQAALERWLREHPQVAASAPQMLATIAGGEPAGAAGDETRAETMSEAVRPPWPSISNDRRHVAFAEPQLEARPPEQLARGQAAAPAIDLNVADLVAPVATLPRIDLDAQPQDGEGVPQLIARRRTNSFASLIRQSMFAAAAALLLGAAGYLMSLMSPDEKPKARRGASAGVASATFDSSVPSSTGHDGQSAGADPNASSNPSLNPKANLSSTPNANPNAVLNAMLPDDDGVSLWASPTRGAALSLDLIPAQSVGLIAWRPAELFAGEEGGRLAQALGPRFQELTRQWESAAGCRGAEVEQVLMSFHPRGEEFPAVALSVRLLAPTPRAALLARWPAAETATAGDGQVATAGGWSYYIPPGEEVQRFALGTAEHMREVAERRGAPPALRTALAKLLEYSDEARHLNLFVTPHDLSAELLRDGRQFYFGPPAKLREPLEWLLGDGLQELLFTAHVTSQACDFELRLAPNLDLDRHKLAEQLRQRIDELPKLAQAYLAQRINPPVYWRQVAYQLPNMIRFVHRQTRIQTEGPFAVLNAHLPAAAAHNLAFGAEMLLSASPAAEPGPQVAENPAAIATIDELLETKSSIAFPQLSLDFAMEAIAQDVRENHSRLPFPFAIQIMGNDLEQGSITRNLQIRDFQIRDATIADILTALVVKANNNPNSTGPTDTRQALIWVVGPDPADATRRVVLVTTRDAAAREKYTLPKSFVPPAS